MKKRIELLSPAGTYESFLAAINNGADAVYLGGKNFSARAFAGNFSDEEIAEAVKYAHLRNARVFITLNTLLNDFELDNALKAVEYYRSINVDAILIQDLGLYYRIKQLYPDMELHCSTQMHVHNLEGVKNAKALGFKRVVLSRESSLKMIEECCKEDIEIEVFCHGAICVSYSGQCLMSSASLNRSANRGMCAQCCRLPYSLYDGDNEIKTSTKYLLSPKDMYLLEDIPSLIEAGVSCIKIEGRMKSSAYVGFVTKLYRRAIDNYYDGVKFVISDDEMQVLKVLFNRGFTNDYLNNRNDNLFGQIRPNHLGVPVGKVTGFNKGKVQIKLSDNLNQFDGIRIINNIEDQGCIVNMLYKNGKLVNSAYKNDLVEIELKGKVKAGDEVVKTSDFIIEKTINSYDLKKLPVDLKVYCHPDEKMKIECSLNDVMFDYTSEIIVDRAINKPFDYDSLFKQFSKTADNPYFIRNFSADTADSFLPMKVINEIRRDFFDKLSQFSLNQFNRNEISSSVAYKTMNTVNNFDSLTQIGDEINGIPVNYVINKTSDYSNSTDGVVSEFGGILMNYNRKIAYYTLNIYNSYAYEFLLKLGFTDIIISSELNDASINELCRRFNERNGFVLKPYMLISGNRTLMHIESDPFIKYSDSSNLIIKDFKNTYKTYRHNGITELLEVNNELSELNSNCLPFVIVR